MSDDSKALPPEFPPDGDPKGLPRLNAEGEWLGVLSDPEASGGGSLLRDADSDDLSALLAAMDPEQRARLIRSAFGDPTLSDFALANEYARQATEAEQELAAERAKVASAEGLRDEWEVRFFEETAENDDLRSKLAKVEAERDGMRAFFVRFGATVNSWICPSGDGSDDDAKCIACLEALFPILAKLPKGTP
jgi:hypothetical protein